MKGGEGGGGGHGPDLPAVSQLHSHGFLVFPLASGKDPRHVGAILEHAALLYKTSSKLLGNATNATDRVPDTAVVPITEDDTWDASAEERRGLRA